MSWMTTICIRQCFVPDEVGIRVSSPVSKWPVEMTKLDRVVKVANNAHDGDPEYSLVATGIQAVIVWGSEQNLIRNVVVSNCKGFGILIPKSLPGTYHRSDSKFKWRSGCCLSITKNWRHPYVGLNIGKLILYTITCLSVCYQSKRDFAYLHTHALLPRHTPAPSIQHSRLNRLSRNSQVRHTHTYLSYLPTYTVPELAKKQWDME